MKHFSLPKDGGLIEKDLPKDILHSYEKIPAEIYDTAENACTDIAETIISEIKDIVAKVQIPTNLEELGVKKEDIDFLVEAGSQQQRLLVNNCKELSLDDIRYLYNKLF